MLGKRIKIRRRNAGGTIMTTFKQEIVDKQENIGKGVLLTMAPLSYWKEFWYKRNGEYSPSTRKFWATVSWIILLAWLPFGSALFIYFVFWNVHDAPYGTLTAITGMLIGNAQMAVGWYSMDKNADKTSNPSTETLPEIKEESTAPTETGKVD
jgi:hypothetical protein